MDITTRFVVQTCCTSSCGIVFAVPADWDRLRRNDHTSFYCPNGHRQHYTGESNEERLKRELAQAEHNATFYKERREAEAAAHQHTRNSLAVTKGHMTRIKKRVAGGVCPCCTRTFQNLARHMEGQHPDYAQAAE